MNKKIVLARHFKGSISMLEMDQLSLFELQTLYYIYWREKTAEEQLSDEQKGALAFSKALSGDL